METVEKPANLAQVEILAYNIHNGVNQTYSGIHPYGFHLAMVAGVATQFAHELPSGAFYETMAACWLHDVIEDCRWTYNDVKQATSEVVAEIVYAVTDELGKNRKERKRRTYPKIAANRLAVFVKLCDRIANTQFSKDSASTSSKSAHMFKGYCEEYPTFKTTLYQHGEYPELWAKADLVHNFN